jgi:hypothetical protein
MEEGDTQMTTKDGGGLDYISTMRVAGNKVLIKSME